MGTDPYREAKLVERTFERGACTWCRAELMVPGDDDVTCSKCGAQVAGLAARALHAKLLLETADESPKPRPWPLWIGRALKLAWASVVAVGAFGTLACVPYLLLARGQPILALLGLLVCLPLGVLALLAWLRKPPSQP